MTEDERLRRSMAATIAAGLIQARPEWTYAQIEGQSSHIARLALIVADEIRYRAARVEFDG